MPQSTITDWTSFWRAEMDAYFSAVSLAHTQGGLKAHLLLNVPPEDRNPSYATNATRAATMQQRVEGFNSALQDAITEFRKTHTDAVVLAYDAHAFFGRMLDAPATYGFGDTTGYCTCTNETYFWYSEWSASF
jgi:phospholipase/lecithinase/hemolysin